MLTSKTYVSGPLKNHLISHGDVTVLCFKKNPELSILNKALFAIFAIACCYDVASLSSSCPNGGKKTPSALNVKDYFLAAED